MTTTYKAPIPIWVISGLIILTSGIGLLFLPTYVRTGAVPHPLIFVINSVGSIICSIALIRLYAWALVLYVALKLAMFGLMFGAPVWFMGEPFTLAKLMGSGALPLLFVSIGVGYRHRLHGWPASSLLPAKNAGNE
jgi:hypothetical protein